MNKKILAILGFFVVIAGMSTAFAFDLNDLSNVLLDTPDDNVTVDGIDFNLPQGFSVVENETVDNEPSDNPYVDYNISSKSLLDNKGNTIYISVSSSDLLVNEDFAKDASEGGNKTTVNGVDGYEFYEADLYGFTFAKDGKLVIISASDKEFINDVVLA